MARVAAEDFGEREVARVYLAAGLDEARSAERALAEAGIDYAVAVEEYWKRTLLVIPTKLSGAAFYVAAEEAGRAVDLLRRAGLVHGLLDEP